MDENDMSSLFIRKRLRWRSDTFMDYLRNTFAIAKKHSKLAWFAQFSNIFKKKNIQNYIISLGVNQGHST